jgi:hypothetical protein
MFENSRKAVTLTFVRPIRSGVGREQMENGIVSSGHHPAKICLIRFLVGRLRFTKEHGLFDQVIAICHALSKNRFLKPLLLRLTAETYIGEETPFLKGIEMFVDGIVDALSDGRELVASVTQKNSAGSPLQSFSMV